MSRPAAALEPRSFGKRSVGQADAQALRSASIDDDLRLFAATFVAGFLFVSILIA